MAKEVRINKEEAHVAACIEVAIETIMPKMAKIKVKIPRWNSHCIAVEGNSRQHVTP